MLPVFQILSLSLTCYFVALLPPDHGGRGPARNEHNRRGAYLEMETPGRQRFMSFAERARSVSGPCGRRVRM